MYMLFCEYIINIYIYTFKILTKNRLTFIFV